MSDDRPVYQRILLKLSGGFLSSGNNTIDRDRLDFVVQQVKPVLDMGVQVCMVVGGGNLLRGATDKALRIERRKLDHIGMMATVINGMTLAHVFEQAGIQSKAMSAVKIETDGVESYRTQKAEELMRAGGIPIFVGGTGHPFFSTDTGGVIRGLQMSVDLLVKGSRVDGVYDKDPEKYPDAKRFSKIPYSTVLKDSLGIMDQSAVALGAQNKLPLVVLDISDPGVLTRLLHGQDVGTMVTCD
jgi:uridylate kinase